MRRSAQMGANMEEKNLRVAARIDLDAIRHNLNVLKANHDPKVMTCAVVKCDGYGHGAVAVAKAAGSLVSWFAVATFEEAMNLRLNGIEKPILVLGHVFSKDYEEMIKNRIRPTIYEEEEARALSLAAQKAGQPADIHIKLDTGMHRLGFPATQEAADVIASIGRMEGIRIEGMFTHFATADSEDKGMTQIQLERYWNMVGWLSKRNIEIPIKHTFNSAAMIDLDSRGFDMMRAGISLYGLYPSNEIHKERASLIPALSLVSHVIYVKTLPKGEGISYGLTYRTSRDSVIATVPVGYGDGYPRSLSNKGEVLIRGKRAPVVGRICMDQFMVDVTDIPGVKDGDPVVLIGRQGDESITAEELAEASGRYHYELLCDLGKRVPREFFIKGQLVGENNCFSEQTLVNI